MLVKAINLNCFLNEICKNGVEGQRGQTPREQRKLSPFDLVSRLNKCFCNKLVENFNEATCKLNRVTFIQPEYCVRLFANKVVVEQGAKTSF